MWGHVHQSFSQPSHQSEQTRTSRWPNTTSRHGPHMTSHRHHHHRAGAHMSTYNTTTALLPMAGLPWTGSKRKRNQTPPFENNRLGLNTTTPSDVSNFSMASRDLGRWQAHFGTLKNGETESTGRARGWTRTSYKTRPKLSTSLLIFHQSLLFLWMNIFILVRMKKKERTWLYF